MKLKTILREDEIQLTLTVKELIWLQVLLDSILQIDRLDGWKVEIKNLLGILDEIKKEGIRIKETSPEFEKIELRFIK